MFLFIHFYAALSYNSTDPKRQEIKIIPNLRLRMLITVVVIANILLNVTSIQPTNETPAHLIHHAYDNDKKMHVVNNGDRKCLCLLVNVSYTLKILPFNLTINICSGNSSLIVLLTFHFSLFRDYCIYIRVYRNM